MFLLSSKKKTRQLAGHFTNMNSDREADEREETPYCGRFSRTLTSLFHTHSLPKILLNSPLYCKAFFHKIFKDVTQSQICHKRDFLKVFNDPLVCYTMSMLKRC